MNGEQAHAIGLVDELAPDRESFEELTRLTAERLATGGPKALSATKNLLNQIDGSFNEEILLKGAKLSAQVLKTPEAQAALASRLR